VNDYVFTVVDGTGDASSDRIALASLEAAKSQMVIYAGEMLKNVDGAFWQDSDWRIDLSDDTGLILCSIMIHGIEAPAIAHY
jgi:hypothetical protein